MVKGVIYEKLSGWRVRICNGKCYICQKSINTKDGYFYLASYFDNYYGDSLNIKFCPECFDKFKTFINHPKPDLTDEYNRRYKETIVNNLEKGNMKI